MPSRETLTSSSLKEVETSIDAPFMRSEHFVVHCVKLADDERTGIISAVTVSASIVPVIRIRPPLANSISITPGRSARALDAASGSGVSATGLNAAGTWDRSHSC